jgi:hypothetical protein
MAGHSNFEYVAASGNDVYIAWGNGAVATEGVWIAKSTDSGATFAAPTNISNGGGNEGSSPQIATMGGDVYVAWYQSSESDVFFNSAVNQPPVADAGPDQIVDESTLVSLDGTASFDPDGTIESYLWTQTSGTPVVLDNAASATPSFAAPGVGSEGDSLVFELTVTSDDGATASDTVTITVEDVPVVPQFTISGFYQPVDMEDDDGNPAVNSIKGGRTVPLKFEVFDQNGVEQTSLDIIQSFVQNEVSCDTLEGDPDTAVDIPSTGGTELRHNGAQYIQNWKTPSGSGSCYSVSVTTIDGSSITAYFQLK